MSIWDKQHQLFMFLYLIHLSSAHIIQIYTSLLNLIVMVQPCIIHVSQMTSFMFHDKHLLNTLCVIISHNSVLIMCLCLASKKIAGFFPLSVKLFACVAVNFF
uniref:Uncharacterized protein n=1 Tax=Cacopsylla melanoneura TaxID=428564 RepID=A0A8D8RAD8_9HEMI